MKTFRVLTRVALIAAMFLVIFSVVAEATSFAGSTTAVENAAEAADAGADAEGESTENPGLIGNLVTLGLLILLQAVLGFDNLLYISLESQHAPADKQKSVRAWGDRACDLFANWVAGNLVLVERVV